MAELVTLEPIDFDAHRLAADRRARLASSMTTHGIDVLLLTYGPNVAYASDVFLPAGDASDHHLRPPVVLIVAGEEQPHVFTNCPDLVPTTVEASHVHGPISLDDEAGAASLLKIVSDVAGTASRVGLDESTPCLSAALRSAPGYEVVDASQMLVETRVRKTPDELECIRRAQACNEAAARCVEAALRPGLRQSDLSAVFLAEIASMPDVENVIDPIWQVTPRSLALGPTSINGQLPFPTPSTDRVLRPGDLLFVDTGVAYHGYASDFGRTWIVDTDPRPNSSQRAHFEAWCEVMSGVVEVLEPGVTAGDLTRAARAGLSQAPWLDHFYLGHGLGLESAEMPLVGSDLGPEIDDLIVLEPGMVLVLEPVIWIDGEGGYRAEEVFVITETGWAAMSVHPYWPFNDAAGLWA